jgi:hypothetical protein
MRIIPRSQLVGECFPQTQQGRKDEYSFAHGGASRIRGLYNTPKRSHVMSFEKILVHEAMEDDFGFRQQEIEIIFRFIGKID